jgi:hypothetical protein
MMQAMIYYPVPESEIHARDYPPDHSAPDHGQVQGFHAGTLAVRG